MKVIIRESLLCKFVPLESRLKPGILLDQEHLAALMRVGWYSGKREARRAEQSRRKIRQSIGESKRAPRDKPLM